MAGAVLGMAMICNQIVAALGGVLVPLGLNRLGLDPALASGTFVTTLTDVMGFFRLPRLRDDLPAVTEADAIARQGRGAQGRLRRAPGGARGGAGRRGAGASGGGADRAGRGAAGGLHADPDRGRPAAGDGGASGAGGGAGDPGARAGLVFHRWVPDAPMIDGPFGARIPASAEVMVPQVVIVPLVGFDARGYRLGYGGGFYDRTLAALRAAGPVLAIGFAYAAQELPEVPIDAFDQRLDLIVTETGVRSFTP
jgi:5-formyltetrahydrofolate cyclo-ligase